MSFVKPFGTHSELFGSFKVRLRKFSLVGLKLSVIVGTSLCKYFSVSTVYVID